MFINLYKLASITNIIFWDLYQVCRRLLWASSCTSALQGLPPHLECIAEAVDTFLEYQKLSWIEVSSGRLGIIPLASDYFRPYDSTHSLCSCNRCNGGVQTYGQFHAPWLWQIDRRSCCSLEHSELWWRSPNHTLQMKTLQFCSLSWLTRIQNSIHLVDTGQIRLLQ